MMQIDYLDTYSLHDACHAIGSEETLVYAIVEHGIVEPQGLSPTDWQFDLDMICTAKRAIRIQRDLHLDWSAVALVLTLLQERDRLRQDNEQLRAQLQRFLDDY
jgi:chaperone modulatory protein CbpM